MGRLVVTIAALFGLVACVADTGPGQAQEGAMTGYIEVSSGGGFSGVTVLRIHADDRIETRQTGPRNKKIAEQIVQGTPGIYQQALALFQAEAPEVVQAAKKQKSVCMDYGTDAVRIEPPGEGLPAVTRTCPDPALIALMDRIRAMALGG